MAIHLTSRQRSWIYSWLRTQECLIMLSVGCALWRFTVNLHTLIVSWLRACELRIRAWVDNDNMSRSNLLGMVSLYNVGLLNGHLLVPRALFQKGLPYNNILPPPGLFRVIFDFVWRFRFSARPWRSRQPRRWGINALMSEILEVFGESCPESEGFSRLIAWICR